MGLFMRVLGGLNSDTRLHTMCHCRCAVVLAITIISIGCASTNRDANSNGSIDTAKSPSMASQLSEEAVLLRLRQEEWLFQRVMLQEGLEESTINKSWEAYAGEKVPKDEEKDQGKQRELMSKSSHKERESIIKALQGDAQTKKELVRISKLILQQAEEFCLNRKPRLQSIESRSVLHFQTMEDQPTAGSLDEQRILIPIVGRDLHPDCVDLKVVVIGKTFHSNLTPKKYLDLEGPTRENPDSAFLVITNDYLKTLTSGDMLEIHAMVSQHDFVNGAQPKNKRVVSYATRSITFYNDRDFRSKVLSTRVPTHDIQAFPLPDEEVEKTYGPIVSDNFYVVDLSIRNRNNVAKLINTGMIVANGRAMVKKRTDDPNEKDTDDKAPEYTIPVSVVPRSATLMYTILDDEEVEQPRAKFFRALELVGALASAVTAPFGGMIANQASNLFSGVFIPSAGKSLPDRWPGFKRNIVNNAMPDLLKLPANSVAGHKHLFFSKNKIDTLISDQSMFDVRYLDTYGAFRYEVPPMLELSSLLYFPYAGMLDFRQFRNKPQLGAPSTKVISLQFDNMDIPFEEVVESVEGQARVNLATLEQDLEGQIKKLERIRSNSGQVIFDNISLFTKRLEDLDKASEQLIAVTNLTSQGHRDFKNYLEAARSVVTVLQPPRDKYISDLEKDLLAGGDSTLENLQRDKVRLSSVSSQILSSGGSQDTAAQSQLRAIADHVKQSERALEVYRTAAGTVQRIGDYILENKSDLTKKVAQLDSNLRDSVIKLQIDFDDLVNKRTKLAEAQEGKLLLMNSLSWTDLQKLGNKLRGKMSLSMTIVGTGGVKSEPEGLACATGTCSKGFDYGIEVTISVDSGTLSTWEGVCSGNGVCTVTMDENKTVTARF